MRFWQHFCKYNLIPLLSVLLVCLFPCVFIYTQNAATSSFSDTLGVLTLYLAIAAGVIAVSLIFFRNFSRAALFADAVMLVVVNFTMISDALQARFLMYSPIYLAVIFIALLLAMLILLLMKKPDTRIACTLISIAFASITLMNVVLAMPTIIHRSQQTSPVALTSRQEQATSMMSDTTALQSPAATDVPTFNPPPVPVGEVAESDSAAAEYMSAKESGDSHLVRTEPENVFTSEARPNVYYMIFDEYAGYENLIHYFHYDNSEFINALKDRGFNVARDSRNSEALYTNILMPNLMNLDYVMDASQLHDEETRDAYLDNSYLVRTFLFNGYQVNLADHLDFIGHTGCNVLTGDQSDMQLSDLLMGNSIFSHFGKAETQYYAQVMDVMDAEKNSWKSAQNMPTITIGYLQLPHSPMAFLEDGSPNERPEFYNWKNDENYLSQLKYTSDYILELVDSILAHDPDCLIILQSDHGCRYPIHQIQVGLSDECDPETEYPYITNILNCVYYHGEHVEIESLTGINTLRRTFNQVLGTDFPDVEPIVWMYDISDRITRFE